MQEDLDALIATVREFEMAFSSTGLIAAATGDNGLQLAKDVSQPNNVVCASVFGSNRSDTAKLLSEAAVCRGDSSVAESGSNHWYGHRSDGKGSCSSDDDGGCTSDAGDYWSAASGATVMRKFGRMEEYLRDIRRRLRVTRWRTVPMVAENCNSQQPPPLADGSGAASAHQLPEGQPNSPVAAEAAAVAAAVGRAAGRLERILHQLRVDAEAIAELPVASNKSHHPLAVALPDMLSQKPQNEPIKTAAQAVVMVSGGSSFLQRPDGPEDSTHRLEGHDGTAIAVALDDCSIVSGVDAAVAAARAIASTGGGRNHIVGNDGIALLMARDGCSMVSEADAPVTAARAVTVPGDGGCNFADTRLCDLQILAARAAVAVVGAASPQSPVVDNSLMDAADVAIALARTAVASRPASIPRTCGVSSN